MECRGPDQDSKGLLPTRFLGMATPAMLRYRLHVSLLVYFKKIWFPYCSLNSFDVWVNRWWKFTETAGSCWFYILVRQTECARGAAKAEWKFRTLSRWPDVINQQVATFWILLDGAWMIFSSNCTWQAIKRTREMDTRIVSPSEFKNTWNYTE